MTTLVEAFKMLESLPANKDGLNYWYWELALEPGGYRCTIWKARGADWLSGKKYEAPGRTPQGAIINALELIPKKKLEQS